MHSPLSWTEKYQIKSGKWIYVPTIQAKFNGRVIIEKVKSEWTPPDFYYHLQKGGHVKALKEHTKNNYFTSLDLSDFFGSMSRTRLTRALKSLFEYDEARTIAKSSTVPHWKENAHSHSIPYGFSQSPILASICLEKSTLGIALNECHLDNNLTITVYMDDIILSSTHEFYLNGWLDYIKEAATKSKLSLNLKKSNPVANKIQVFNIELSHKKLQVNNKRFEEFKKVYTESLSEHQRYGISGYISTVNSMQLLELSNL
ncbi:reverse transcriptase domain-containing protein [Shewanella fidelis]|uniref:Reverse transcriptase domain-containing protein n=1 Tax=Shewanella fidelis TaxID=173509 RepID=A0AAW8NME2_9GAMM|nr:reverse transcriptase domain-containing protein [Shewanella fidelis]MDR8523470.1 reverse transcriptase domain-containing protein [Shewanella fidelis]MDW4813297.1 reverse transcriptase domain-containing protein [Shewanella fidelis]MDW4817331.1 reverse transcriptase domain-containing protein [Shewanella fidelis]MDW4821313.1 reverse transcriptase domain-containing protein [Shewanella fidelis]MDW4824609.1 reverse transcriptase domain-containing protein [Shewanella fidelis]